MSINHRTELLILQTIFGLHLDVVPEYVVFAQSGGRFVALSDDEDVVDSIDKTMASYVFESLDIEVSILLGGLNDRSDPYGV